MAEFDLGRARQEVLDVLGMALGERGPDVEALDAGLRLGLDYVIRRCAAEDREVTLAADYAGDNRLDLGALLEGEALHAVVAAYRVVPVSPRRLEPLDFSVADPTGPVLEVSPRRALAGGEVIVLRVQPRYEVRDLDGAAATTLPPVLERAFVRAAAGEVLTVRMARAMVGGEPASDDALEAPRRLAGSLRSQADALLGTQRASARVMAWLSRV
jgi:hypothetical protein